MTARFTVSALALAAIIAASPAPQAAETGNRLILAQAATTTTPAPATPPADGSATTAPAPSTTEPATPGAGTDQSTPSVGQQPDATEDGESPDTELSLGEIPSVETMELTPDIARRALDSYIAAKEKYANSDLDQYENLQDFVDQTEDGKKFEADVKAAGFANVTDWNLAVTTLGLVYGSVLDDQTADLLQQIKEVEADPELAQDIKDRMVKAMKALIPSENNKKIVQDMMADPVYGDKLKLLDIEEE